MNPRYPPLVLGCQHKVSLGSCPLNIPGAKIWVHFLPYTHSHMVLRKAWVAFNTVVGTLRLGKWFELALAKVLYFKECIKTLQKKQK